MADKKYYWLKFQKDFFSSKRIKKLRKLAGGDTFTIIYLKMQLLSLDNGGVIEYTGLENSFAEELALDIDEDTDNVAITVNYLLSCGLLEEHNDQFFLPYVAENTGKDNEGMDKVREQTRQRVANHRAKQKLLECNVTGNVTSNASNALEKEIEIEKDIEIDIEKEKEKDDPDKNVGNTRAPSKRIHGEHKKVRLTDDELQKLKEEYQNTDELIQFLDEYKAMTGKTYKSDYLAIKKWVVSAVEERKRKNNRPQQKPHRVAKLPSYMTEKPKEQTPEEELETIRETYKLAVTYGMTRRADIEKQKYFEITGRDIVQDVGEIKQDKSYAEHIASLEE